jgi:hypothetical protein
VHAALTNKERPSLGRFEQLLEKEGTEACNSIRTLEIGDTALELGNHVEKTTRLRG